MKENEIINAWHYQEYCSVLHTQLLLLLLFYFFWVR